MTRFETFYNLLQLSYYEILEDGSLADILKNADVLIGLSAANIVTEDMIKSMNEKAIVFVLANPTPEIMPDKAKNGLLNIKIKKARIKILTFFNIDFQKLTSHMVIFYK